MVILKNLIPRIFRYHSRYNGELTVVEFLGRVTLYGGGMVQSGGYTKGLWKKAISRLKETKTKVKKVLVLGIGGGTIIKILEGQLEKIQIIGVEIDPVMVQIAQKHFLTSTSPKTRIVVSDAFEFLANSRSDTDNKYQLIILDLFIGDLNPSQSWDNSFWISLKKKLDNNGIVIMQVNFQNVGQYRHNLEFLEDYFKKIDELAQLSKARLVMLQ